MTKKNILFPFVLLLSVFIWNSCSQNTASSFYNLSKPEALSQIGENLFNGKFSPDGKKILMTTSNNSGLHVYDIEKDELTTLNTLRGAGFDFRFTPDSKYAYYVTSASTNKRQMSNLMVQNLDTKERNVVTVNQRNIRLLDASGNFSKNSFVYFEDEEVREYNMDTRRVSYGVGPEAVAAFTNANLGLTVLNNGVIMVINPKGSANYVWVSLSPDKSRVLFTATGKGTFSCNLNGSGIIDYGYLNAPKWSKNGDYIIGMVDEDDGQKFTKSDIVMVSADGSSRKNLTKKIKTIALFPDISPDEKTMIFNDEKGVLYKMNIK